MRRVHVVVYDHTGLICNVIVNRWHGGPMGELLDRVYKYYEIFNDTTSRTHI